VITPEPHQLFGVLDATWPPARFVAQGPWTLREGKGGGQRVSAATANSPVTETDIDSAEARMHELGQSPIFMIRPQDTLLDAMLGHRGYRIADPVTAYVAPIHALTRDLPPTTATPVWPPLTVQREIWEHGGIDEARIAVMERAASPKTTLLGRAGDSPAGVAFVAVSEGIAMLHALEVATDHRRLGLGAALLHGAANWALAQGAAWLALMVTTANAPANALYRRLSMVPATNYHYRRAPEDPA
jgi:GNAT superfamily N-acetyltransferase